MPETITAKQLIRTGNLVDLPILDAGEQGYATDANRLFIGNTSISQTGDSETVEFNFGVDLDLVYKYVVTVDGAEVTNYTVDNFVIEFAEAPAAVPIVLYYNTEQLTYVPDREDDPTRKLTLYSTAGATQTIDAVTIDYNRYDNCEITYSIREVLSGNSRLGKLNISLNNNNTATIDDQYTVTNDDLLPHVFGVSVPTSPDTVFTLQYSTTSEAQVEFSYKTNYWSSNTQS